MPLPRYQPLKKKAKVVGASLEDLDDSCLSRIIAHALEQSKARDEEPYVGDNGKTERSLSLVSRRWYFLTQTQVADHGVHKIDLDATLRRASDARQATSRPNAANLSLAGTLKTPRRIGLHASSAFTNSKTPGGPASARKRLPYGVLSQRNLTVTNGNQRPATNRNSPNGPAAPTYDIKLFRAIQPKLLKYKHVQLAGSLSMENLDKLLVALNSARVQRLDLLKLKVENARSPPLIGASGTIEHLSHLRELTCTWANNLKAETSNALLWGIYERATNLRELQVYLIDDCNSKASSTSGANNLNANTNNDSQQSNDSTQSAPATSQCTTSNFNGELVAPLMSRAHPHLLRVVFERLLPAAMEPSQHIPAINCEYSILIKRVLGQERSILSLDTNDCSLIEYLIQASNRICTKHELQLLRLTHPIRSLEMLQRLVSLPNLGTNYLSIVIDNVDQMSDVKASLENFSPARKSRARCQLNLYLRDQKFTDSEDKVKHLISLCRLADVNVYISALQRISIDCCHLMWSTGRALQAMGTVESPPGRCIFKISLQTYPIKANTVNPCEITIPFGKCSQYRISSSREDIIRHREIMRALKRDCYHQFVKSVRDNNNAP